MAFDFNFNNFGGNVKIQIDEDNQAMCPQCKCKFKQLIQHLKKNSDCITLIENFERFRDEYQLFTNRRRQRSLTKRKLEADAESFHKDVAKKVQKHRKTKLENNAEELHTNEATRKRYSRGEKLENNAEELHANEATRQYCSRRGK